MPYKRRHTIPAEQDLVIQFEKAIRSLVRRFQNHPYVFYTESDLHCYLYHRLYAHGTVNGLYKTKEGHDTILLHKEYPTDARYKRQQDKILINDPKAKRRGAFDICLWDPKKIDKLEHRKQKVLCAAELALNECGKNSVHTINDATKLSDPQNEVKNGYLLFFVRDDARYSKNAAKIQDQLKKVAKSSQVAFARVQKGEKDIINFLGNWRTT